MEILLSDSDSETARFFFCGRRRCPDWAGFLGAALVLALELTFFWITFCLVSIYIGSWLILFFLAAIFLAAGTGSPLESLTLLDTLLRGDFLSRGFILVSYFLTILQSLLIINTDGTSEQPLQHREYLLQNPKRWLGQLLCASEVGAAAPTPCPLVNRVSL